MAKITPEELIQDVREHLQEDYTFDPPRVPRFFTSNIFGRVFAHLVGRAATAPKMLRCTEAGELKTAPTTTGIEKYLRAYGNATDAWANIVYQDDWWSRVDIFIWDNPASVRLQIEPGVWGQDFEVPVGFYSLDCRSNIVQVKNKTAGQTVRYQIIVWW